MDLLEIVIAPEEEATAHNFNQRLGQIDAIPESDFELLGRIREQFELRANREFAVDEQFGLIFRPWARIRERTLGHPSLRDQPEVAHNLLRSCLHRLYEAVIYGRMYGPVYAFDRYASAFVTTAILEQTGQKVSA